MKGRIVRNLERAKYLSATQVASVHVDALGPALNLTPSELMPLLTEW